ncbi:hypothetical protein WR25_12802 [Diploscapter pachys]|uniref:Uncharacterized protein n=1 Tax=Diploscapter pachys TaxID=2018661 RepID=A0A2A2LGV4_9BILA|nr:hypothetical protein WR25_12802 [Diploscapter pachys]
MRSNCKFRNAVAPPTGIQITENWQGEKGQHGHFDTLNELWKIGPEPKAPPPSKCQTQRSLNIDKNGKPKRSFYKRLSKKSLGLAKLPQLSEKK